MKTLEQITLDRIQLFLFTPLRSVFHNSCLFDWIFISNEYVVILYILAFSNCIFCDAFLKCEASLDTIASSKLLKFCSLHWPQWDLRSIKEHLLEAGMLEKLLDLDFSLQTKCRILKTTGCNFTISLTTELDQPCPHLTISKWISYI